MDDQFLDQLKERNREMKVVDATRDVMFLRGKKSWNKFQRNARVHREAI